MKKKNNRCERSVSSKMEHIKRLKNGCNLNYIVIAVIISIGIGVLIISCSITNPDWKNILVGLGTGVVTSAMVTLFIDFTNANIEQRKLAKFKRILLTPLCDAVTTLYVQISLSVNKYRVREEKESHYFLLPLEETNELSNFFNKMKKINIENVDDKEKKNKLENFISIPLLYFKEVISQYERLPFESLLLENIITQEEYDRLKRFVLFNECKRCIALLGRESLSEQEKYYASVQLFHCMMEFVNRLIRIFDLIAMKIETENVKIKECLNEIYYNEVYVFSDEYVEQCIERGEEEAEYYAEHPELLEEAEKSAEEQLYDKILDAIWLGDVEMIKKCFPQIDKHNEQIQSLLTWSVAENVMKDEILGQLYFQKYGIKYKVEKDKKRKKRINK